MDLKHLLLGLCLPSLVSAQISVSESEQFLSIQNGANDFLCYHKAALEPPTGVDPVFRRNAVIHPIKTPNNGVLTGVHPDDHYHHIGIWHAWVKTVHGLDQPDFWNLKKKTGRVRFVRVLEKTGNGFAVEQEQVAYKGEDKVETVVLKEILQVSASFKNGANVIDYVLTQTNVSGVKLELPAYRYGGPLAYRGPLNWNRGNSEYLTSEDKTRVDSHTTRANWCMAYGDIETGRGTLLILGHPKNHDAPHRLRTWDNGKMFLNIAATQEHAFAIGAGDTVTWKFRLIAADGVMTKDAANQWWAGYSK
jgi:hypothetical protein